MPLLLPGFVRPLPITRSPVAPPVTGPPRGTGGSTAPAPTPKTTLNAQNFRVGVDQATLGPASVGPMRTWILPNADINNINLTVSGSYSSGATVSGSIAITSAFSEIRISRANGTPIVILPGVVLHELYKRYGPKTEDYSETALTVAASASNAALNTTVIPMGWLRLPALGAPYAIEFRYVAYSALGSFAANNGPMVTAATGVTAASINTVITVIYGTTEGLETRVITNTILIGHGVNDIAQLMSMKKVPIDDLLLYGWAADGDFDHETLITQGSAPIPYESGYDLIAAYEGAVLATRATGVFWQFPTSRLLFDENSMFQVTESESGSTTSITALYYRVAAPNAP